MLEVVINKSCNYLNISLYSKIPQLFRRSENICFVTSKHS